MRRLVAATVVTLSGLLLFAAPAGATKANADGGTNFNPIGPILVMLGIGALIFGAAYFLDKRKD
jgi:hypothetical protein